MKKADILNMESIAYYSGFTGLEIKKIEYGINDYMLCVSGAWGAKSKQKPHKLKIYYPANGKDSSFVRLHGYKVPLDECIRMGVQSWAR